MGKMPILEKDKFGSCKAHGQTGQGCTIARPLPVFYMSDYSVLGLLVDRLEEAVRVLAENRFQVLWEAGGDLEVVLADPGHLQKMTQVLTANRIGFEIADVVSGIYQG
jgi:hypothetical protein